tara:strand:+ start:119 stop:475 length:357 start_codon:yes stop_codon:yes gene_type:complete
MEKITLSESELINAIQKVIKEDAGKDTPGGNPEYFYGGSSLDKLRNMNQDEMKEDISRDGIIEILNEIYELQLQKAPAIAQRRLDELFEKVGIGYWSYPSPSKMGESRGKQGHGWDRT